MCLEYHTKKNIRVGDVQADNVTASKKAFRKPNSHMAVIGFYQNNNDIIWVCGGSIISSFFILSDATCVEGRYFVSPKWVRIGNIIDLLYLTTEGVSHQDFRVVDTFIHPDYEYPYHNIALLKLEEAIVFGDDYQPACLHTHTNLPEIMEVTVLELKGTFSFSLRELKFVEYKACAILHRDHDDQVGLRRGRIIDEIQICAWDDSGNDFSPLEHRNVLQYKVEGLGNVRGHHVVAGVGAYGPCCSVIFTRVSAYLDWIEDIVWEDEIEPETVTFTFTN